MNANQIAQILKSVKPASGFYEGSLNFLDQWNDTVKAFGEQLAIPHPEKNKPMIRTQFYAACDADPTNWRI